MKKINLLKLSVTSLVLPCSVAPFSLLSSCSNANMVKTKFCGKKAWQYDSINGKNVVVEGLYKKHAEKWVNNPDFAETLLVKQCVDYKKKHPNKEVHLSLASYHMSILAGACVDKTKPNFGQVKEMHNTDEDKDGYVRVVYQVIKAAKAGINCTLIGHTVPTYEEDIVPDLPFNKYVQNHLNDLCDDKIHVVGDYLRFKKCYWTVTEKAATDMMHLKSCMVSNYIDINGQEHDGSFWVSSQNLDTIMDDGRNGMDASQTGVVVSDHQIIANCIYNYTNILLDYCGQDDAAKFRTIIAQKNKEQINLLLSGKEVPLTEQIVYLGSKQDDVFEFYFTPFDNNVGVWDSKLNPYCKYIDILSQADRNKPIELKWLNPNFVDDNEFTTTLVKKIDNIFYKNGNRKNKLFLGFETNDSSNDFKNLVPGKNIGEKYIGDYSKKTFFHEKDLIMSYYKNNIKHCVCIINTLNFHRGALYYQANTLLVIKENQKTLDSAYKTFSSFMKDK